MCTAPSKLCSCSWSLYQILFKCANCILPETNPIPSSAERRAARHNWPPKNESSLFPKRMEFSGKDMGVPMRLIYPWGRSDNHDHSKQKEGEAWVRIQEMQAWV